MNLPWPLPSINACVLSSSPPRPLPAQKWYQRDERKKVALPGHSFWSTIPQLCVAEGRKSYSTESWEPRFEN